MRRALATSLLVALAGCGGPTTDTDGGCVRSGTYDATGSCFGMAMTVDVTANECAFTLDHWNMAMTAPPTGGSVDGDIVTMSGGDLDGCTGTKSGDTMSGTCVEGCSWEFTYASP